MKNSVYTLDVQELPTYRFLSVFGLTSLILKKDGVPLTPTGAITVMPLREILEEHQTIGELEKEGLQRLLKQAADVLPDLLEDLIEVMRGHTIPDVSTPFAFELIVNENDERLRHAYLTCSGRRVEEFTSLRDGLQYFLELDVKNAEVDTSLGVVYASLFLQMIGLDLMLYDDERLEILATMTPDHMTSTDVVATMAKVIMGEA